MEKLKNLYAKDIDREIQGVIKVDDESFISQELEEYVVTDELLKHFRSFFSAYNASINGHTEKMGVWISGFFGSGKSHFLKILSYLLENKIVDGKHAVDYFEDKIADKLLLADMKRVGSVPNDVILFNIDSKASLDNIDGKDKILSVFEKVFNEKLGLSTIPHVAELERFLIKNNKYDAFKENFKLECNDPWEAARNDFYFRRDEIVNAYSKTMNKSHEEAENWFDKAEENYDISIEKFAIRIREYIESKGNNNHVIFLIDEVGQYAGTDNNALLNLQTVVEDLGLECGGKAWVCVTSQEAIDDVVKVHSDNFSKIQGRFDTRLSLSSINTDEVIKKRILAKTTAAEQTLEMLYDKNESIIRNLLTFKNASYQKTYEDNHDFAITYPFTPYQFKLLQDVFTDIRKHGFAGKHLSSGERSLLGAFQETAKKFGENEIGTLVPFYAFYDTIEQFLEGTIRRVFQAANDAFQNGELQEIDINILKVLFMLKNIKEIPANIENIATLYSSNINEDKLALKKEIVSSLKRLENQTLIQRNNEEYKFLTDEEQEINREIKQITIDQNKVTDYLKVIVYDQILNDRKFSYKNKQFPLTLYLDNIKYSQEYEIGIKVVTVSPEKDDNDIIINSIRDNRFIFVELEIPNLIYEEINNCLKVDEYIRSQIGIVKTQQVDDIIRAKGRETQLSEVRIKDSITECLKSSEIIISGDKQIINAKDAKSRIIEALEILVNNTYSKFNYVAHNFTTSDIRELFHESKQNLLGQEVSFPNQKAYDAMKEYFEEKNAFSFSVTIRNVLQEFGNAPYGFLDDDILYLITRLLKDEVINLVYGNEVQSITSEDTLTKILKRDYYDKTIIKIRKKISNDLINDLKSVARNSFNKIDLRDDEDGMASDFKEKCLTDTINKLRDIRGNYNQSSLYDYPGREIVEESISNLDSLLKIKDITEFFENISYRKENIQVMMHQIESILEFFNSKQKEYFDQSRKTIIIYDANKDYADKSKELESAVKDITDILTMDEPYSEIHNLPTLREHLNNILGEMYDKKSAPIIEKVNKTIDYIKEETERYDGNKDIADTFISDCKRSLNCLEKSNELKDIYAQETRVDQLKDAFIHNLEHQKNKVESAENQEPVIPRKIVRTDALLNKSYEINNEADIDKYLSDLKAKLLKELKENDSITIR